MNLKDLVESYREYLKEAQNVLVAKYSNKFGGNTLYFEIWKKLPSGNLYFTLSNQHGINTSPSSVDLKSDHATARKNVEKTLKYYDQDGDRGALKHLNSMLPGWKKAPLKEETEQLDELSPSTLKSYKNKATNDFVGRSISDPKLNKRIQGAITADKKLHGKSKNEKVDQIDEAKTGDKVYYGVKIAGKLKIKSGKIVAIRPDGKIELNTGAILDSNDKVSNKSKIQMHRDFVIESVKELPENYSIKRTKEKKSTSAHPDGKPIHHILHKGEVVGTIEPYSAYKEKRKPGSRIVQSRTNVTKYSVHFHAGKGPTKSADMPLYHKLHHSSPKSALQSAEKVHSDWLKKNESVKLKEGILKPYHTLANKPWSQSVKDKKGTAAEYSQIAKGKDFTVWTGYTGSLKRQAHYVVRDDKIIGSGWTMNAALKDAGLKDADLTHRSKFSAGSILNKGMKEDVDLNETVEVSHDRYMRSHGKKARDSGVGQWMFTHKERGDVNYKDDKEVHAVTARFADAKKSAKQWAKKHGHSRVYVMESVDDDFARDHGGSGSAAPRGTVKKIKGHNNWWAKNRAGTMKIFDSESKAKRFAMTKESVAVDNVMEEAKQLDELSPSTLKSYMKKAGKSERDLEKQDKKVSSALNKVRSAVGKKSAAADTAHRATTQAQHSRAGTQYRAADKQIKDTSDLVKQKSNIQRKLANRMDGMARASDKLQKESTNIQEQSQKVEIPKSLYNTIAKAHGDGSRGTTGGAVTRTPKGNLKYKGARHLYKDDKTGASVAQTYSHPEHGIATIEVHYHPDGEKTYHMFKKP